MKRLAVVAVCVGAATGLVAGCGGKSASAASSGTPITGQPVDGPHETLRVTYEFNGSEYQHRTAGERCSPPAGYGMFVDGAPVAARDADDESDTGGWFGELSSGQIVDGGVEWCQFEVKFMVGLGPQNYKIIVGIGQTTLSITASEAELGKKFGHTGGASPDRRMSFRVVAT